MAMRTLRTSARNVRPCRAPVSAGLFAASKRHASYQMNQSWFNDFYYPAAAKNWLTRAPQVEEEDDAYPAEYVYLDELEERIEAFHEQYPNSKEYDRLYNEYGWTDHETPLQVYGSLPGKREAAVHGRGQKISPEWYFNPTFHNHVRQSMLPVQYMAGDVKEIMGGQLADKMQMPPEEPSVFKFWNPYQLFGTGFVLFVSKEWFLLAHDSFHAILTWVVISAVVAGSVDWWYWWYAVPLQEGYDRAYFPMNQRVKELYERLENMELNGSYVDMMNSFSVYSQKLGQSTIDKKLMNMKSDAAREAFEKMDAMFKKEQAEKKLIERSWTGSAYDRTMAFYSDTKNTKDYLKSALSQLSSGDNASLQAGAEHGKSTTTTFADKYKAIYDETKNKWFTDAKTNGTLPWSMADAKDRKAAQYSAKKAEDLTNQHIAELRKLYHNFA